MADNTAIEWTDATWNPVTGCSVLSPGCTNCYAMKLAGTRMRNTASRRGLTQDSNKGPVWNGQVRLNEEWLDQPLRWKKPRRIFVCAHGDLFHENVPDEWIDRVFAAMQRSARHTFQVLTKRADRMRDYVAALYAEADGNNRRWFERGFVWPLGNREEMAVERVVPFPNVWLGVSVEDQDRADERIWPLVQTPAAKRFISAEPLLGPLDLTTIDLPDGDTYIMPLNGTWDDEEAEQLWPALDWVIVGGESGPNARPMHPDWARSLRDQCEAAGVAYFFKQWGEFAPGDHGKSRSDDCRFLGVHGSNLGCDRGAWEQMAGFTMVQRVGKKAAGRLLDGREWNEVPA